MRDKTTPNAEMVVESLVQRWKLSVYSKYSSVAFLDIKEFSDWETWKAPIRQRCLKACFSAGSGGLVTYGNLMRSSTPIALS
jgi:hypothetical protein